MVQAAIHSNAREEPVANSLNRPNEAHEDQSVMDRSAFTNQVLSADHSVEVRHSDFWFLKLKFGNNNLERTKILYVPCFYLKKHFIIKKKMVAAERWGTEVACLSSSFLQNLTTYSCFHKKLLILLLKKWGKYWILFQPNFFK